MLCEELSLQHVPGISCSVSIPIFVFFSKTSKSQAKKQKVAKKPRGEKGADPYDFESDEGEQDTGCKFENNVNGDFVCLVGLLLLLLFIFLSFVCVFVLPFFSCFLFFFFQVDLSILSEKRPYKD